MCTVTKALLFVVAVLVCIVIEEMVTRHRKAEEERCVKPLANVHSATKKGFTFWRLLCFFGIHWRGKKDLGMYGDAARCSICGTDGYGVFVIKEDKEV